MTTRKTSTAWSGSTAHAKPAPVGIFFHLRFFNKSKYLKKKKKFDKLDIYEISSKHNKDLPDFFFSISGSPSKKKKKKSYPSVET